MFTYVLVHVTNCKNHEKNLVKDLRMKASIPFIVYCKADPIFQHVQKFNLKICSKISEM